ncbi:MAG: alpha-L-rhamnosidase N-terminal domain-containing protein, partial [candidate division KSB1 bacterium]|nr:alpha-L-rhamnosidase N-terminal domain-containing protein [candidate division KSB1 bacterium]
MAKFLSSLTILALLGTSITATTVNPRFLKEQWEASWISHPTADLNQYGVYHFRKTFSLDKIPDRFIVHLSADNRYRLFVNGRSVCTGPERWDLAHWRFESVDLTPYLSQGKNVLAAVVWNFGEHRPWGQLSWRTAFILQGDSEIEAVVNSDRTWKVLQNSAYSPIPVNPQTMGTFTVVGPGEEIDGRLYPWGWAEIDYDDSKWPAAKELEHGKPRGYRDAGTLWLLTPRQIPPMEETLQRNLIIRRAEGITAHDGFLSGAKPLEIPPNRRAVILLDNGVLTTAYPHLTLGRGRGASVKLTYAEALVDDKREKGNRNEIKGRTIFGYYDIFHPDGGEQRSFSTLWFRTYRYLQLDIATGSEPLLLHDLHGVFTAYPFTAKASFESSDPSLKQIWETGWRTARLCANETYFDCPYYEQLQYVGDTRIQALISLYVSGDDRLMRKAIELFNDSRTPDGLTSSRYPTTIPQVIPPYSLFWIDMIHDYWLYRGDEPYLRSFLIGIEGVLDWYEQFIDDTGMLGPMPWWHFVDWPDEWAWSPITNIGGVPAGAADGHSAIITLQYVEALLRAAELMQAFGKTQQADHYLNLAESLKQAVHKLCWDPVRRLYADTPEKQIFSQHVNVNAVLVDLLPQSEAQDLLLRILSDRSLIQCTMYYRFYLFRALKKVGIADLYVDQLEPWREMLRLGLTTFAERPEPTRSDCHAWSASPNYDFLATIVGIEPAAPGFRRVLIRPALGRLQWVKASLPHPA